MSPGLNALLIWGMALLIVGGLMVAIAWTWGLLIPGAALMLIGSGLVITAGEIDKREMRHQDAQLEELRRRYWETL